MASQSQERASKGNWVRTLFATCPYSRELSSPKDSRNLAVQHKTRAVSSSFLFAQNGNASIGQSTVIECHTTASRRCRGDSRIALHVPDCLRPGRLVSRPYITRACPLISIVRGNSPRVSAEWRGDCLPCFIDHKGQPQGDCPYIDFQTHCI